MRKRFLTAPFDFILGMGRPREIGVHDALLAGMPPLAGVEAHEASNLERNRIGISRALSTLRVLSQFAAPIGISLAGRIGSGSDRRATPAPARAAAPGPADWDST